MEPLLSGAEMIAADRAAIESGIAIDDLMERAGQAVARAVVGMAGGRYGRRIAVVCAKGNNGGDGFVAARLLRRAGMAVTCLAVGDMSAATGAAAANLRRLRRAGVDAEPFDAARLAGADVIVDALFGTGFKGPVTGAAAEAIEAIDSATAPVVAVDLPSGVDANTGAIDGPCVAADVTVAFAAQKVGTAVTPGVLRAGRVEVVDIGIPWHDPNTWLVTAADVAAVLPRRPPGAHKATMGVVALLMGSDDMPGAAVLAARGAMRAGSGYVTLGTTPAARSVAAAALPEILHRQVVDGGVLSAEALVALAEGLDRAAAVAIGPGMGTGDPQRGLVEEALAKISTPLVLDADGLNVLAGATGPLTDRSAPTVITPHPAELARLLGSTTTAIGSDRLGAVRTAAERFGCVALLKGPGTIVAEPGGTAVVVPVGGPELATAGSGDVLTGVLAARLASGLDPFVATWAAVFEHAVAGRLAAEAQGGPHIVAWDIAEALPRADAVILAH